MNNRIQQFDALAPRLQTWKRKNVYYYACLGRLYGFLIPPRKTILEIGCAHGDLLAKLKPVVGAGIDYSPRMIAIAKKKYPHLTFNTMNAESLNSQKVHAPFDYIIMQDLIGDLDDVWQSFHELQKVSDEHTRVVISYYNHLWEPLLKLAERFHFKMNHGKQNWLALEDIENLLTLNNFEVVKKGKLILLPKKIPFFSTFCNTYLAHLPLIEKFCLSEYVIARKRKTTSSLPDCSCSIIIPTRNEAGNIEEIIKRIPKFGSSQEIIFVNKNHNDDTELKIKDMIKKYPQKNILFIDQGNGVGKGDAVRKGFDRATGDILMILDADMTVAPEELPKFYLAIKEGKGEFINGTRLVYPMEKEAMRTLNLFGNKMFSLIFTWLLDQRIKDTLCGTKVLRKKDYEYIKKGRAYFGDFDPFGDFDLLFGAAKQNMKIVEVPIRYHERTYGTTNIQRFKHGLLLFRMCLFALRKLKFR